MTRHQLPIPNVELTPEQWKLVVDNDRLIYFMANKLHVPIDEHEAFYHECGIPALMRAASKWNPKIAKFSTYACNGIFMGSLTWRKPRMKELAHESTYHPEDMECVAFAREGRESTTETRDLLEFALKALTPREQEMVRLYSDGWSYQRIGDSFGTSHESARNWIKRALAKARDRLVRVHIIGEASVG